METLQFCEYYIFVLTFGDFRLYYSLFEDNVGS